MYILQNQQGYFLAKSGEWVDGREPITLFRTAYKDEALNQLFETNSKNYELRIQVIECDANPKGIPVIAEELLPEPQQITTDDVVEQVDLIPISTETAGVSGCDNNDTALTA